jgi:hypothetical protein
MINLKKGQKHIQADGKEFIAPYTGVYVDTTAKEVTDDWGVYTVPVDGKYELNSAIYFTTEGTPQPIHYSRAIEASWHDEPVAGERDDADTPIYGTSLADRVRRAERDLAQSSLYGIEPSSVGIQSGGAISASELSARMFDATDRIRRRGINVTEREYAGRISGDFGRVDSTAMEDLQHEYVRLRAASPNGPQLRRIQEEMNRLTNEIVRNQLLFGQTNVRINQDGTASVLNPLGDNNED